MRVFGHVTEKRCAVPLRQRLSHLIDFVSSPANDAEANSELDVRIIINCKRGALEELAGIIHTFVRFGLFCMEVGLRRVGRLHR